MTDTQYFNGTVNDVYPALVSRILEKGKVTNPRGKVCREINPSVMEIHVPNQRLVTSHNRLVNVPFALAEVIWILAGRSDKAMLEAYNGQIGNYAESNGHFNAAYGHRLRLNFGFDQLQDVIDGLKRDRDTRQAGLVIADPTLDRSFNQNGEPREVKDRACNVYSHAMIREDKLQWLQVLRSNDAIWGVPYNLMQWTHIMEYIASELRVDLGHYVMVSDSMHIYEQGESAGELDNARNITPFNLYAKTRFEHRKMPRMDEDQWTHVFGLEAGIRQSEDFSQVRGWMDQAPANYWGDVLYILAGWRMYKLVGQDPNIETDDIVAMLWKSKDPVYAFATMKLMYQNRWSKDPDSADEACGQILARIPDNAQAKHIFQWVTGRVLD